MNHMRLSYLKWAAVVAVLAMAPIASMRTSKAKNQPVPVAGAATGADLANEARVISKYDDDLAAYDKQSEELGKRARLVSADFDPLQRKSDDLKARLSEVQNAAREIVRKLKAAGEWDDLDTATAARIAKPSLKSFFQETSFKQDLEEVSSGRLTSHANEISTPLDNLRKRLTGRYSSGTDVLFVRAAYEVPAPMAFVSLKCSIAGLKIKLIQRLGGGATEATLRDTWAKCHPGQAYPF